MAEETYHRIVAFWDADGEKDKYFASTLGSGFSDSFQEMIADLGLPTRVEFRASDEGWYTPDDSDRDWEFVTWTGAEVEVKWKTDGKDVDLPASVTLPRGMNPEDEERVSEWLSAKHGWLVSSYSFDETESTDVIASR
tara:strand:- start:1030 stop:1443 length:414 start_codon:yes stop_codon:yes gene_type:complete